MTMINVLKRREEKGKRRRFIDELDCVWHCQDRKSIFSYFLQKKKRKRRWREKLVETLNFLKPLSKFT